MRHNTFHFVLAPSAPVSLVIVDGGDDGVGRQPVPLEGAVNRHDADVPGRRDVGARLDAGGVRQARRRDPERHDVPAGRRRRRAQAVRRTRRRAARRRRRPQRRGRRARPTCSPARLARPSIARPAAADRSASSTTAIRCSRSSRRRAAATSPPPTSSGTARSRAGPADRVLARFDDGAVAAAERKIGDGRVIVWTSTLDDTWTDIGVKPIFLPLVHQLVRYLAHYEPPTSWLTVGQVLDLTARAKTRTRIASS